MFINHTKKYVYLRVPKTGTTSFQHQLIEDYDKNDEVSYSQIIYCGVPRFNWEPRFDAGVAVPHNPHLTLKDINTLGVDTTGYSIYASLRHPVDRFVSRAYHMKYYITGNERYNIPNPNLDLNEIVEEYLDQLASRPELLSEEHMWKPQSEWLIHEGEEINKIFLYEDIKLMMRELTGVDVMRYTYRTEPRTDKSFDGVKPELVAELEKYYAKDFELYNKYRSIK